MSCRPSRYSWVEYPDGVLDTSNMHFVLVHVLSYLDNIVTNRSFNGLAHLHLFSYTCFRAPVDSSTSCAWELPSMVENGVLPV